MRSGHEVALAITAAVSEVAGDPPAALHEPEFGSDEQDLVRRCIESTFVSSVGAYVDELEQLFSSYTGCTRAVATVNGTAALQVALLLAGVRPGDEVIVPSLSFIATANAVTYTGATCLFMDVRPEDLGINADVLRAWLGSHATAHDGQLLNKATMRPIRAIVPVHVFGHPCDISGIMSVAQEFGLQVVEDAAESLGSFFADRHTGTFGCLGAISLNGNKIITAGGGGMILTNDPELGRRAKHLTTTAKMPHKWDFYHDQVGFNFRMPNLNAALGVAQFSRLETLIEDKRALYDMYRNLIDPIDGVTLLHEPKGTRSNYWLQTVLLDDPDAVSPTLQKLNDAGYGARPVWRPLHTLPPYQNAPRAPLPVTMDMAARVINLPSSARLGARREPI